MTDFPDDPPPGEYRLGRTVVLVGEDTLVRVQAELAAAKRRIEELEAGLREYAQLSNWSYGGRFDANDGDFDGISFAESVLSDKEGNDA